VRLTGPGQGLEVATTAMTWTYPQTSTRRWPTKGSCARPAASFTRCGNTGSAAPDARRGGAGRVSARWHPGKWSHGALAPARTPSLLPCPSPARPPYAPPGGDPVKIMWSSGEAARYGPDMRKPPGGGPQGVGSPGGFRESALHGPSSGAYYGPNRYSTSHSSGHVPYLVCAYRFRPNSAERLPGRITR